MTSDDSWDAVKKFVEPVVAEIDSPGEVLLELRVVIPGDDQTLIEARFPYGAETRQHNAELLQYAAKLIENAARWQLQHDE